MTPVSIVTCIIGGGTFLIGLITLISAQMTKAKQDGALLAKIDQCVSGINEIKTDMKDKNKEIDRIVSEHSLDISRIKEQIKALQEKIDERI